MKRIKPDAKDTKIRLTIYLSEDVFFDLEREAKRTGFRTVQQLIDKLAREYARQVTGRTQNAD